MPALKITLRAARNNAKLTLKDASKEFKIHLSTLSKYEADSSNVPFSFISKIEGVYGIPVSFIYFGKEEEYQAAEIV